MNVRSHTKDKEGASCLEAKLGVEFPQVLAIVL